MGIFKGEIAHQQRLERIELTKQLLAKGLTHQEIAENVGVKIKTINQYLEYIRNEPAILKQENDELKAVWSLVKWTVLILFLLFIALIAILTIVIY